MSFFYDHKIGTNCSRFCASQFKWAIAEQVASLTDMKPEQALSAVEIPKKEGVADFSLCVAKLNRFTKLKGKPQDVAVEWADKVPWLFHFASIILILTSIQIFSSSPVHCHAPADERQGRRSLHQLRCG